MEEPYDEDIASHIGPKLCGGSRKGAPEALVGVCVGQVLSREIRRSWSVDVLHTSGRQHHPVRYRKCWLDSTRSVDPVQAQNHPTGNRDIPYLLVEVGSTSREVKSKDVPPR